MNECGFMESLWNNYGTLWAQFAQKGLNVPKIGYAGARHGGRCCFELSDYSRRLRFVAATSANAYRMGTAHCNAVSTVW